MFSKLMADLDNELLNSFSQRIQKTRKDTKLNPLQQLAKALPHIKNFRHILNLEESAMLSEIEMKLYPAAANTPSLIFKHLLTVKQGVSTTESTWWHLKTLCMK